MTNVVLKLFFVLGLSALSFFSHADASNVWNPCADDVSSQLDNTDNRPRWDLAISPYTHHWRFSQDHKPVFLAALEERLAHDRFCGVALFRNSFGQPSAYAYAGKQWNGVLGTPKLFTKVSAGLIYGYKGKFQDKIPFNDYGVAPAIIPSLGWQFNAQESAQVMVLGTAGLLFAYGRHF